MISPVYPCAEVPEIPEAHYSRLCPRPGGYWDEFDAAHLAMLASLMCDSPAKRKAREKEIKGLVTVPSGYVYFGQFIDHDITRDIRKLKDAGPDVEQTLNYRTPRLDLDLLYGRDPAAVSCIYENDGERLRLDLTERTTVFDQQLCASYDDLPR